MSVNATLTRHLHHAAHYAEKHGITKHTLKDSQGRVCATGAVMHCQPLNGDEYIIRAVQRNWNQAEEWNDKKSTTPDMVLRSLRREITDEDLESTFGLSWKDSLALIRAVAKMTQSQAGNISDKVSLQDATETRKQAYLALSSHHEDYSKITPLWDAVMDLAEEVIEDDHIEYIWSALGDAATAVTFSPATSPTGFTLEHYRTLAYPVLEVLDIAVL